MEIINNLLQGEQVKNLLSYGTYIQDLKNFKRAGTRTGDEFNYLDTPGHLFFKILFYFHNGDIDNPGDRELSGGLLSPTWNFIGESTDYYNYNSAWSYLKMNNENERAEKLEKFVNLLSNINTYSPWYFQSIEGLDQALTRTGPDTGEMKFEERRKLTVKCLIDSHDNRIGTLMDLYRDMVWSWLMKREVIPSNLRKFDMGIYIFSSPVYNIHDAKGKYANIGDGSSGYITSYKYLEFHNCEFDYNSVAAGYQTLDNTIGTDPLYNINIYYDDCYETRYNEFMMRKIGDMIMYDVAAAMTNADGSTMGNMESIAQFDDKNKSDEVLSRIFYYDSGGLLNSAVNEVVGWAKDSVKDVLMPLYLGNIYNFSLRSAMFDVNNLMSGKVFATVSAAKDFVNKNSKQSTQSLTKIQNIFKKNSAISNI